MGGPDEQLQGPGGGDFAGGTYQQLTLDLFPSEAEQIRTIDEAENVKTSSAFSFAQKDIDHVLRLGGNTDRLRERVAAEFEKQKSLPEIAAILHSLYHGGNGFTTDAGSITVWYGEDGIHLSRGKSARYDKSAQVISWESAAERIGELLEFGQFASNVELAEAAGYERLRLAEKLWNLCHDLSDEARESGYLQSLVKNRGGGFPEETERLADHLKNPEFRKDLMEEYAAFWTAYQQDRDVLRFHYHNPRLIWENLKDLNLPRKAFSSEMVEAPTVKEFITEDEIGAALSGGSGFAGGRGRIYTFFQQPHTDKEQAAFLREEYGTGGRSHALSGATGSDEWHDGKGLRYQKKGCEDIRLTWDKTAKLVADLIKKGRYLTEAEREQVEKIQSERELAEAGVVESQSQPAPVHEAEAEPPQPTLGELLEQYKPVVTAAISEDTAYRNACGHSDHENAVIEGNAAVRRAVLGSGDIQLIKHYSDIPDFRHRLHQEVVDETYPRLHEFLRPLSQDDIDDALRAWNGDMDSKRAVVRYMKDHARDKGTAAWLSKEYGGPENKSLFIVRAGSPETIELPWPKVQRRIAQLIQADRFYTPAELDNLDDIDPVAIRENLAQRGIVNGQVAEPEKLDNDPFIQQVMTDVEQFTEDEPRYSVVMTSDAFPDPEDAFAVWDNQANDYYITPDGTVRTFSREEDAAQFLTQLEPQEINTERQGEPEKRGFVYEGFHFEPVGVLGENFDANATVRNTISHNELGMSVYAHAERPYTHAAFYAAAGNIKADVFRCLETGKFYLPGTNELFEYTGAFEPYQEQAKELVQETPTAEAAPAVEEHRDPLASAYKPGDTVYLDDTEYEIEGIGIFDVDLSCHSSDLPALRTESKANFERLIQQDERNRFITDFFPANLEQVSPDLREVLTGDGGLLDAEAKEDVAALLRSGAGNRAIAQHLSQRFSGTVETMQLETGDTADYRTSSNGMEVEILRDDETVLATMYESWEPIAAALRTLYQQELDGFSHEPVQTKEQPIGEPEAAEQPDFGEPSAPEPGPRITTTPVTRYPGEQNNLPYDIEIHRLRFDEPEPTPPQPTAENFHITDIHLGEGGPKAKFRANMDAISLLKELEFENRQATPEEQEILSRYVGWGGLSDAFDESKPAWAKEFAELYATLSPEEYEAARGTTLNAHYTTPTVIQAIYEAVGKMGFQTGNILEPSCGVGNFFGMLPEEMRGSKLYGVELDSITGRIAKQLYPKANITIAGFETTDRRDFYDLAVGNVPYGQYQVNDRAYNKLNFNIHNYFFAKSLDQVRPGGVVAFLTSRYTMDSKDSTVRRYLAQRAELLGAIRLPNNAFKANAGTEVVSDIIFLQKRDRPIDITPDWTQTGQTEEDFTINRYFLDHPEMVLGRQEAKSTQYGGQDYTVVPIEGLELSDQLHDAIKYIRGTYQEAELPELGEGEEIDTSIPADPDVKNYSYTVVDGSVYYRENSRMVRPDLNATAEARIKGMVELRDCVQKLIGQQMDGFISDETIRETQAELNRLYDAFSAKYGLINDRGNRLAFADDSSYYLLCALEVIDDDGKLKQKADMFTKRTIKPHEAVTSVDTASEALAVSIAEKAEVDMEYMAKLSGRTPEELALELRGVIFRLPGPLAEGETPRYVTADEYLSGNVRRKLRQAQRAAEKDPAFSINVEALTAAQPKDLDASEIEVRLGATWIDKEYIQQFMYETFRTPYYLQGKIEVKYVPYTAEWQITSKNAVGYGDVAANTTYGTDRANAYKILEDSLNLRDVRIYDTVEDEEGRERRVLNAKETTLAAQKQQAIRDAFKDWIWKDPQRRQTLVRQYNEEMNSIRPREYDGQHIRFAGMNPEITLREHQKNAIAHVLYGGNTLLAHEVGAGKTFEMVAAAMESKRLGLCQKSLFVVPNHLTEQWASEFLRLYPSANILVTTKKDFESHNRKKFCARIATGDYDAVIIGHSQFERIPISRERQERLLREQIQEITDGIAEVEASGGERFTVKQLERTKKSLEARLEKLQAEGRKDDVITFEQLGVDRLFVDESHNYKNLFLYTKMRNVAGLSTTDAQKSSDMFAKCRYMDEITGSRGVVFATGTPVSNSMTELYTVQRYLQYERLQELNMTHFDCWASRFGETVTALELAPEGTGYRARTRFSKFFNLPELMNLFKEVADIKTADQLDLPTPEVEYHNIVAKPTEHQQDMVKALSERAAKVHSGTVDPSVDNMLKITSDGRKLGLDQRIINPMLPDEPGTKVNQCVDNILQIWRDGQPEKLTQLVFCDISTPQAAASKKVAKTLDNPTLHALEQAVPEPEKPPAFTVYEDIRQKLIAQGMPASQIAFIHEANTEVRKKELFSKVRSGQVRVLLGSTQKMGAGTNVQDLLVALHDLDCPWRPGDVGRILRTFKIKKNVEVTDNGKIII
ncbi:SNF2-related protein [Lachnospiraceae bacterium 50-23]